VDLKASAALYDAEGNYRPPLRALSWDDYMLLLPTGHVEARRLGDDIWAWWEWDDVVGADIQRLADPNLLLRAELEEILQHCMRTYEDRDEWMDAREAEEILDFCLRGVRAGLARRRPRDLSDPRAVHELGERAEHNWQLTSSDWRRFAAYVDSLEDPKKGRAVGEKGEEAEG
jgi:hypothetical protein